MECPGRLLGLPLRGGLLREESGIALVVLFGEHQPSPGGRQVGLGLVNRLLHVLRGELQRFFVPRLLVPGGGQGLLGNLDFPGHLCLQHLQRRLGRVKLSLGYAELRLEQLHLLAVRDRVDLDEQLARRRPRRVPEPGSG